MKSLFVKISIAACLVLGAVFSQAQTIPSYCTPATPCATLSWTNGSDITATEVTNSNGVEISGPAVASMLRCTVTSTQACTVTNGVLDTPSAWAVVAITNKQSLAETTNSGGPFYDTSFTYGPIYNYTLNLTWKDNGLSSTYAVLAQVSSIGAAGVMSLPVPGSVLTGASTTFSWKAGSAGTASYYLWVGTSSGAADLVNVGPLSGTSITVNLPTTGATIYVQLYTHFSSGSDLSSPVYTYVEATAPPTAPSSVNVVSVP